MKKTLLTTTIFALAVCGAHASSVAINFQRSPNGEESMLAGASAGVIAQTNWNNVTGAAANSGSIADMVTDGGVPSGVAVSWAGDTSWSSGNGTANGDNTMMGGYLDDTADPIAGSSATFAGISYSLYDVYVYFGSDGNDRTGTITDGTTTFSYATNSAIGAAGYTGSGSFPADYLQTTDTGAGSPEANYAIFSGLSGAGLTITNFRGSNNTGIHGIQIIQVPEPGSMTLLLTGACAVLLRRRR